MSGRSRAAAPVAAVAALLALGVGTCTARTPPPPAPEPGASAFLANAALAAPGVAAPAPGLALPPDRITTWKPGLGAVGGIPRRTKICKSLSPSGRDDTAQIQAAIDACPANQVVQLAPGNYNITDGNRIVLRKSRITLRGSVDAGGRPATRFLLSPDHVWPAIAIGEGSPDENFLAQPNDLTADAPLNATSVTVKQNQRYVPGELVTINQLRDASIVLDPANFGGPGKEQNRNMFVRTNRFVGQVLEVKAVSGSGPYTLTFTTPLHARFTVGNQAQVWRHSREHGQADIITEPVQLTGVEDLYFAGGHEHGAVTVIGAKHIWLKNLEVFNWRGVAVALIRCFRSEYRDSYVHQAQDPNPGGGGYILSVEWHAADNLVENNIHWAANKVMVMRSSGGGNVIGYNYMEDGFGAGYPTIPESGINASHFAGSHMELFEGNQGFNFAGDTVWGNALYITAFRNHFTGLRRNIRGVTSSGATGKPMDFQKDSGGRAMVQVGAGHDYYTFLGNILGYPNMPGAGAPWKYQASGSRPVYPAIWVLGTGGTDQQYQLVQQRTIRHGNWDYGYTNGVVWDPKIAERKLPASLYLDGPPPFFGSNPWPWVDATTGKLGTLPARARFDAMLAAGKLY